MNNKEWTQDIKERMYREGVTGVWLAGQLGVSQQYISSILTGRKRASMARKKEIVRLIAIYRLQFNGTKTEKKQKGEEEQGA